MPTREIGLMGYVGEAVVGQWLALRFATPLYEIARQVMPVGIPKQGGPYLDYAVVSNGMIVGLYEVKCQNVIWEAPVNIGLDFVWRNCGAEMEFVSQDGRRFQAAPNLAAYLVLLGPPNDKGIANIGEANLANVLLFDEIVADLDLALTPESIMAMVAEDVPLVLAILRQCSAGRLLKPKFLAKRERLRAAACIATSNASREEVRELEGEGQCN